MNKMIRISNSKPEENRVTLKMTWFLTDSACCSFFSMFARILANMASMASRWTTKDSDIKSNVATILAASPRLRAGKNWGIEQAQVALHVFV